MKPSAVPVRFLLVGCGTIGDRHAQLASSLGQLVAVCDLVPLRARRFSQRFECYGYTSLDEMLRQQTGADVLIVCTPNGLHAAHSIAGLKKGLHVLCEKPMALRSSDARNMIAAANKAGKHLVVVKQNRFNPPVAAVKQLLDKGKLGQVYSIQVNCFWNRNKRYYTHSDWKGTKELDGGVLFTQFSHFADLLWWFFGGIASVKGFVANRGHQSITEVEDTGVFSFVTHQQVPGTFHYTTNACNKNYEGSVTLFAEKGTIKIGGPYLNTIEYQEPVLINPGKLEPGGSANTYQGYAGSMNNHAQVYRELLQLIQGQQNRTTRGEEGLESVVLMEQFYKAAGITGRR
ncbi:MAG TPA: Gfo/Idh/MocA family oxidoreductase [Lacibacter sp.]|nr:Gfo/Idh/MocA family oxidoreductase [Lacibacter sp.]